MHANFSGDKNNEVMTSACCGVIGHGGEGTRKDFPMEKTVSHTIACNSFITTRLVSQQNEDPTLGLFTARLLPKRANERCRLRNSIDSAVI
jgi:hypothetical protein